jgi:hypothetical protein
MTGEHILSFAALEELLVNEYLGARPIVAGDECYPKYPAKDSLIELAKNQPGSINVLDLDLKNIKTSDYAKKIVETVNPTPVVFAAGYYFLSRNIQIPRYT